MLTIPKLELFRNGEFIKYISHVLSIGKEQDLAALQVQTQAEALEKAYQNLIRIYKEERGSKLTAEIVELDRQRDQAFLGLRWIVYYYSNYHHDKEVRDQSGKLLNILDKHGLDVTQKSYQEQGAALDDILDILKSSDTLMKTLDQLHLTDWFNQLKTSNETFDRRYLERNREYAEAPKEKLKILRNEAMQAYRELARFIAAYATIHSPEKYQAYINQLNQITESYNLSVNNRKVSTPSSQSLDEDSEVADS